MAITFCQYVFNGIIGQKKRHGMKNILLLVSLLSVAMATNISGAFCSEKKLKPSDAIFDVFTKEFPTNEKELEGFLFYTFAPLIEDGRFRGATVEAWEERYEQFANSLIQKSESNMLDSKSLEKCLKKVLKDAKELNEAYLPIAAYSAKKDQKPVWIIVVGWEGTDVENVPPYKLLLSHIKVFVYDVTTIELVGYTTCM